MKDTDIIYDTMTESAGDRRRMVYIPVEKLFPHPDNPRKDLGDLAELTDSIIANGVMQNLTVIPSIKSTPEYDIMVDGSVKCSVAYRQHAINHAFTDDYTIIIGHRRHAAATLAGVKELPCVVVEMDYPTQIAAMMTENLQRADLTVFEQAQGFKQLSIDFGMSVESIAEKTGFSASTVRRRLKMSELNQDTLKEVSGRQINMADFDRLYGIEDPKLRDAALKEIGTANFSNKCYAAEQEQKRKKKIAEWRQVCLDAGFTEVPDKEGGDRNKYAHVDAYYTIEASRSKIEKYLAQKDKICFYIDRWGYVYLVSRRDDVGVQDAAAAARAEEDRKLNEKKAALKEAFERAYQLRYDFIDLLTDTKCKAKLPEIMRMAAYGNIIDIGYGTKNLLLLMGATEEQWQAVKNDDDKICECINDEVKRKPHFAAAAMAYAAFNDRPTDNCYDFRGRYDENETLTILYEHLCALGYEMSDEEKALMDGTSKLYVRDESGDDAEEEPEEQDTDTQEETDEESVTRFDWIMNMDAEERKRRYDIDPEDIDGVHTPEEMAHRNAWICPVGSEDCPHTKDGVNCVDCIFAWLKETSQNGFDDNIGNRMMEVCDND